MLRPPRKGGIARSAVPPEALIGPCYIINPPNCGCTPRCLSAWCLVLTHAPESCMRRVCADTCKSPSEIRSTLPFCPRFSSSHTFRIPCLSSPRRWDLVHYRSSHLTCLNLLAYSFGWRRRSLVVFPRLSVWDEYANICLRDETFVSFSSMLT